VYFAKLFEELRMHADWLAGVAYSEEEAKRE